MEVYLAMQGERGRWVPVMTCEDASRAVRAFIEGGNPAFDYLGASQMGKGMGNVRDARTRQPVARISYNGRIWRAE